MARLESEGASLEQDKLQGIISRRRTDGFFNTREAHKTLANGNLRQKFKEICLVRCVSKLPKQTEVAIFRGKRKFSRSNVPQRRRPFTEYCSGNCRDLKPFSSSSYFSLHTSIIQPATRLVSRKRRLFSLFFSSLKCTPSALSQFVLLRKEKKSSCSIVGTDTNFQFIVSFLRFETQKERRRWRQKDKGTRRNEIEKNGKRRRRSPVARRIGIHTARTTA